MQDAGLFIEIQAAPYDDKRGTTDKCYAESDK